MGYAPAVCGRAEAVWWSTALAQGGEEDDLADGATAGEEHDEAVDADAEAAGGRHAVLQGDEEVLVQGLGLVVAGGAQPGLLTEAGALLQWVVELRVGVAELEAAGVGLEPLDVAFVLWFSLGK